MTLALGRTDSLSLSTSGETYSPWVALNYDTQIQHRQDKNMQWIWRAHIFVHKK